MMDTEALDIAPISFLTSFSPLQVYDIFSSSFMMESSSSVDILIICPVSSTPVLVDTPSLMFNNSNESSKVSLLNQARAGSGMPNPLHVSVTLSVSLIVINPLGDTVTLAGSA